VFVHDRMANRWKAISVEGTLPTLRLFTPWLASAVRMLGGGTSPGRENERDFTSDRLPNVQAAYAFASGGEGFTPGVLVLQNIEDGRKIRIETGQEDSEVLSVGGDTVLYRINDAIYKATIADNGLKDTSVMVKDDDVPEVHWVFYGP